MTQTTSQQHSETLASLRDHYRDALARGETYRAMDVASVYRRLTDRLISEDVEPADWRTPIAEAAGDPEPDRIIDPGAWFAWRHRMVMGAAIIV